ncbi:HEPN domain-containing protein [Mucilaginibacter galii]|uniref:Apea-like HEPN domain-containing protein n=1 Tax=Mucilaginibacter galii TaxID=2005073 RepID=A0A917N2V9_9SPHI|nr:HEPN domain-containing protein [Mucilaginibacter galii]GGI52415.1 hypothetical protein GCM10011425_36270 [Mucilaginibacter galii]
MTGQKDKTISVIYHQRTSGVKRWCLTPESLGVSSTGYSSWVDMSDEYYRKKENGNASVWALVQKNEKSEIEKRSLQAITWIGNAVADQNPSKSLVQYVFAIEGMLQYTPESFITPSIISQIGDWLAFIIGEEKDERKSIVNYFKNVYRKRSAIAHGGAKTITQEDLSIAMQIAKHMVISFLTKPPFSEMKTVKDLSDFITDCKFR